MTNETRTVVVELSRADLQLITDSFLTLRGLTMGEPSFTRWMSERQDQARSDVARRLVEAFDRSLY